MSENLEDKTIVKPDKVYKTASYTRRAVKNYENKIKMNDPEKYKQKLDNQRAKYNKMKETLKEYERLKQILIDNNISF